MKRNETTEKYNNDVSMAARFPKQKRKSVFQSFSPAVMKAMAEARAKASRSSTPPRQHARQGGWTILTPRPAPRPWPSSRPG